MFRDSSSHKFIIGCICLIKNIAVNGILLGCQRICLTPIRVSSIQFDIQVQTIP